MKLHADPPTARNTVTGYGAGFIEVNRIRYESALRLAPDQPVASWEVATFDALRAEDLASLLELEPDIVLLGTGSQQRFPHPRLTQALAQARVGLEVMDTQAACRTYNILVGEGRRVVAALLIDS